jgi:hypothetical protein
MNKEISQLGWSQQQRFHFMERQLLWGRRLTLSMVQEAFDISRNQASRDIKLYRQLFPENVPAYNPADQCYRPSKTFAPMFAVTEPHELLTIINNQEQHSVELDAVAVLSRHILEGVLPAVLTALEYKSAFEAIYASASNPIGTKRTLVPSAIVYVDNRLHLRAWCNGRKEYRDFVLSRILTVPKLLRQKLDLPMDKNWETWIDVVLIPNPKLSSDGKELITREYQLSRKGSIKVRAALVHYFLQTNFLPYSTEQFQQAQKQPWSYPILVRNWNELEAYIFGNTVKLPND